VKLLADAVQPVADQDHLPIRVTERDRRSASGRP
jgi:hypothetical protein